MLDDRLNTSRDGNTTAIGTPDEANGVVVVGVVAPVNPDALFPDARSVSLLLKSAVPGVVDVVGASSDDVVSV